ncbi:MAG: type II toxin-antitoxin system PemK/MazF family toxin [Acidobacteria bacterium]|nr:type II toxin-antitoxin system PemK/MazF family toxin [Acidobacteriota bacterium]
MLFTTTSRQDDSVLVSFPFTDFTSSKKRPALVVSPDAFNSLQDDLVLAAITSQVTDDPNVIPLEIGDFIDGQLPKTSLVKTTKLFTIHSSLIVKRVCGLRKKKIDEILEIIRRFFS